MAEDLPKDKEIIRLSDEEVVREIIISIGKKL